MSQSIKKYLSVGSWLVIAGLAVFGIYDAVAYFSDLETSANNTLGMSDLDFSLNSPYPDFVTPDNTVGLLPGLLVKRDIYLKQEGFLPFQYKASIDPLKCDPVLLDRLHLEVWYNYFEEETSHGNYLQEKKYEGTLADFQDFDTNIPNHDPDLQMPNQHAYYKNIFYSEAEHWFRFKISLAPDAFDDPRLIGTDCNFDLVFEGWQENYDQADQVFSDVERINNTVYIHSLSEDLDKSPIISEPEPRDLFDYSCGDNCPDILLAEDASAEILAEPELAPTEIEETEAPLNEPGLSEELVPDPEELVVGEEPIIEEIAPEPEPVSEPVPEPEPVSEPEPIVNNPEQDV